MIYFLQDDTVFLIKIGFTEGDDAEARLRALQTGSPVGLTLLLTLPGDRGEEARLHEQFASARVHGEWFRPTPQLLRFLLDASRQTMPPSLSIPALACRHDFECFKHDFFTSGLYCTDYAPLLRFTDHVLNLLDDALAQIHGDHDVMRMRGLSPGTGTSKRIWDFLRRIPGMS